MTKISHLLTGILFSLLLSSTVLLNTTGLAAAEPLTLADIQPPPAIEGENYRWIIPVQGGIPPYTFSTSDELPLGLLLDSENGIIFGTPQKCMKQNLYKVKILVKDRTDLGFWRIYSFTTMYNKYRSNIKAGGAPFAGEVNFYIGGNIAGTLKSGQNTIQYFSCGDRPQISVDDEFILPTDNSTRYKPVNRYITVSSDLPDAEFIFFREYLADIATDPPEAGKYPPNLFELTQGPQWYKEGDIVKRDASLEVEDGNGTKYVFSHWLLPTYEKVNTNRLDWQITKPGKVVACYKTYFLLDTGIPLMIIEGGGWKEKNTSAKWVIKDCTPRLTQDIGAFLGVYYFPYPDHSEEFMDKPKTISFNWGIECRPALGALVIALLPCLIMFLVNKYRRKES